MVTGVAGVPPTVGSGVGAPVADALGLGDGLGFAVWRGAGSWLGLPVGVGRLEGEAADAVGDGDALGELVAVPDAFGLATCVLLAAAEGCQCPCRMLRLDDWLLWLWWPS